MKARLCLAAIPLLLCHAAMAFTTDTAGKTIYTDGSSTDVQAAINAASDGWTVVLPNGTHSWSSGVSISGKGIHLKGNSSSTVSISGSASPKIDVTKDSSHPVEISGINFSGGSLKIRVNGSWAARAVIIHDCSFLENLSASTLFLVNGGLIYNCQFTGSGGYNDQAVKVKSQGDDGGQWYSPDTLGMRDTSGERNVYVENCTFTNLQLQCFDFDGYARIVVRNSTFSDSAITSHGADTSPTGLRHFEVYNNRFIFHNYGDCDGSKTPNMDYFIYIRGGTGCIYSNVMDNMSSCAWGNKNEIKLTVYNITRKGGQVPCQTVYPAFQQIGQGYNTSSYFTDPLYIWGNSSVADVGVVQYSPDECGNAQKIADYLKAGRDFITGTARPNYTPYSYPHPLRSGGGTVTPQAAAILSNPTSQSVTQSTSVTLNAVVSGSTPINYQWQKNQGNITGATAATYSIGSIQSADAGTYRVIAVNAYGSATSSVATVSVVVPTPVAPTITTSPQSLTRTVGSFASFTVSASGSAPLTYQWQKNLVNISGATSSTYTISSVALADTGSTYRCIVSNSAGTATSSTAVLTVNATSPNSPAPLPQGNNGIAAQYANDASITSHPDVIFADTFESYTSSSQLGANWSSYYQGSNTRIATETGNTFAGGRALELALRQGSSEVANALVKNISPVQDTLFVRAYTKFDAGFANAREGHNGIRISSQYPGPGNPANGSNFFMFTVENSIYYAEGEPGYTHVYGYYPEQRQQYGDHWYPNGKVLPFDGTPGNFGSNFVSRPNFIPQKDRWYSYEFMVKANTPGMRDGRVAIWIDGEIIADFQNVRVRDVSTLRIDQIQLELHAKSSTTRENKKWYDNVVVAKSYIGPMVTVTVSVPAPPSNFRVISQ